MINRLLSIQIKHFFSRAVLRRAWWLLLALIHVAPLFESMRWMVLEGMAGGRLLSGAAIWLTFTFFVLKFLDVGFLRWRMRRASVVAFVLACALVHDDAAPAAARSAMLSEMPGAIAASVLMTGLLGSARLLPRALRRLCNWAGETLIQANACGDADMREWRGMAQLVFARPSIPRAPPAQLLHFISAMIA